jgi:hypothetical protein
VTTDSLYRTKVAETMNISILQALAKSVQLVACEKGCPVVLEGEVGDHMYILVSGCCVIEKADRTLSPGVPSSFTLVILCTRVMVCLQVHCLCKALQSLLQVRPQQRSHRGTHQMARATTRHL